MSDHHSTAKTPAAIAATLREIADQLDTLPADMANTVVGYAGLAIQPLHNAGNESKIAVIDAIAQALLGYPGRFQAISNGSFHHDASGHVGVVSIGVYGGVESPAERERKAEMALLRAELDAAKTALARRTAEAALTPDAGSLPAVTA